MRGARAATQYVARAARGGFSMIEMLIAITISATLLTATLTALNSSFIQYKVVTESASTHVVSRIVMHRILSMVRTGSEFGPFPVDVLDASQNPVTTDWIEFVSSRDSAGGIDRITRIEHRDAPAGAPADEAGALWYVLLDPALVDPDDPTAGVLDEHELLPGVEAITFTLEYDIGPRLRNATVDMTIRPNDSQDMTTGAISASAAAQTIRLIASAAPRQLM